MSDESGKRPYELRERARAMDATRLRITEAAVELHGSVGPARTTITAVAERAGVQRHTVYRHFPTEDALFEACSTQYWSRHPWPDLDAWAAIEPADRRLAVALDELYRFYGDTAPMMAHVLHDEPLVAAVRPALAGFRAYLGRVEAVLAAGRPASALLGAAVRHAVDFSTYARLAGDGLDRADAVRLMTAMIDAV